MPIATLNAFIEQGEKSIGTKISGESSIRITYLSKLWSAVASEVRHRFGLLMMSAIRKSG
jgi:hypothetical protein